MDADYNLDLERLTGDVCIGVSLTAVEALIREARVGHKPGCFANLLRVVAIGITKDAIVELAVAKRSILVRYFTILVKLYSYQMTQTILLPDSLSWCSLWNVSGITT